MVTPGYSVVTSGYLVVTSGYLIFTIGYFSLLLVPRFSNNDMKVVDDFENRVQTPEQVALILVVQLI